MNLPLTREEFESIYRKVPRVNVEVVVKTDKGVVLTLRKMEPEIGRWHIPGGTIYLGESVLDAVKRVARDELGVEVEVVRSLGYIEYPNLVKKYWGWPIGLAFEVKIVGGVLRGGEQGQEIGEFDSVPDKMMDDQGTFLERVWSQL